MTKTSYRSGAVSAFVISSLLGASSLLAVGVAAPSAYAADATTVPHSYLVFFDFNKSNLTPEAVKIVDQAASDAAAGKATQIVVTGYTDTVGSDAYNMRLSKRRALSVQAELAKQGVPADSVAIYAKGKHDLLVPTADGVKEPQNRRASIAFDTPAPAAPPAPAPEAAAPAAPPGFSVWAQLEAGITANPNTNYGGINYGHLFTDKANQVVLNQLLLTAEKPIDTATDYDVGFRLQGMFGTDARYTHFLGELDDTIKHDRTQLDIVEAWVGIHTPWLGEGGMDIKVGQYPTLLGAEVIDPSGNFLYSKSYIFNYGLPLKNTGIMTITHVNSILDIYAGVDTGVNTTFPDDGDPNTAYAFQGGFGLNGFAFDGKLSMVAFTHIGPENPIGSINHANSRLRYLNDIVFTMKWSDALTTMTELNLIKDDGFHALGWGIAEYGKYQIDETVAFVARAELFRDNNNFYVASFGNNHDFVRLEKGLPLVGPVYTAHGPTTYGEITLGLSITPSLPGPVQALTIRPEVRLDGALNGHAPFNGDSTQVTFGLDFILKI